MASETSTEHTVGQSRTKKLLVLELDDALPETFTHVFELGDEDDKREALEEIFKSRGVSVGDIAFLSRDSRPLRLLKGSGFPLHGRGAYTEATLSPEGQSEPGAKSRDVFSVIDRVMVVTGGLGQLGREYCLTLLSRGARVAVLDKGDDVAKVRERYPDWCDKSSFLYVSADVTSKESLARALEQVVSKWGVPHGLINNAALDSPPNASADENGPFESYPAESWDKVMEVNAKGAFLCCQVIGGRMAEAGRGSIINVASTYGVISPDQRLYEYRARDGKPFFKPVAYSASKSALINLTRYLATYWAPRGVRVNTLTPAGVWNNQDEQFLKGYTAKIPLGRMAYASEYNGAIVFLLSDASSYMTGSNLVVDGGMTAW